MHLSTIVAAVAISVAAVAASPTSLRSRADCLACELEVVPKCGNGDEYDCCWADETAKSPTCKGCDFTEFRERCDDKL